MSDTQNAIVLTDSEVRRLLRLPEALQLVIDGHHVNEAEADAIGEPELASLIRASEDRRKVLEAARDALLVEKGDKPGDLHFSRYVAINPEHVAGVAPIPPDRVKRILANIVHATLHILDDWAGENAQTGEVTVEIPADEWKELNRVIDLLGDDPHELTHDLLGVNDPPSAVTDPDQALGLLREIVHEYDQTHDGEVDDNGRARDWSAIPAEMIERARQFASMAPCAQPPGVIKLTPAEIQSNYNRVQWAEGLIRQLPETHDGRNSWLLNYGTGPTKESGHE